MKIIKKIKTKLWIYLTRPDLIDIALMCEMTAQDQKRIDAVKNLISEHVKLNSQQPYLTLEDFYPPTKI